MSKLLQNDYRLDNKDKPISAEEIKNAFAHFEYYMSNFQQIVNKERQVVPFKLNAFQEKLFETILPMVHKDTRQDRKRNLLVVKSRQTGASVSVIGLIHYLCAYADLHNLNIAHVFPVGDTITKFYNQKVMPIITGVHPSLFPDISRQNLSTSILTNYENLHGIPLDNYYELISSGSSAIRSSTINILIEDEVAFYKKPEELDAAILPAIPDHGFSMVVYLTTVGENAASLFFVEKLKIAMANPDDWTVVFVPWFFTYPEKPLGIDFKSLILDQYEEEVLVPAFKENGLPKEKWGDCIKWYRLRLQDQNNNRKKMKLEYPTTLDEVMLMGENRKVWPEEIIASQDENIREGRPYEFVTVNATGKVEARPVEASPFLMFDKPVYGRKYRIAIDPITAHSGDTDYFAMHVMDLTNNSQAAVFRERNLSDEDYADWAVSMAKLYNNAELCPEINVANGFIVAVNALHYYHWYYENAKARKDRTPGLRTTVSTKEGMISNLTTLLERKNIKIRDKTTLDELRGMEKIVKRREDGTSSIRMAAKKGKHDDLAMAMVLFAGSLTMQQLQGKVSTGGMVCW